MTTIRDLLNDFAEEIELNEKTIEEDTRSREDIIDEYIGLLKERIVG